MKLDHRGGGTGGWSAEGIGTESFYTETTHFARRKSRASARVDGSLVTKCSLRRKGKLKEILFALLCMKPLTGTFTWVLIICDEWSGFLMRWYRLTSFPFLSGSHLRLIRYEGRMRARISLLYWIYAILACLYLLMHFRLFICHRHPGYGRIACSSH